MFIGVNVVNWIDGMLVWCLVLCFVEFNLVKWNFVCLRVFVNCVGNVGKSILVD